MRTTEALHLLRKVIPAREPVMLMGAPGLGKSALVSQAASAAGYGCRILNPALLDPTDLGGVPMLSPGAPPRIVRALDDVLLSIVEAREPLVLFLDEMGQASPSMQAACAPVVLDRRIGGRPLPDHVSVICASNRRADRAGAGGIVSHMVSRMMVVSVEATLADWLDWALPAGVLPEVTGFLRFRPALLHQWDATTIARAAAGEPYPCPRSWERASRVLGLNLSPDVERHALMGCVGEGAGREFEAYLAQSRDLPDVDQLLAQPDQITWDEEPSRCYALACAIAYRANTVPERVVQAAHGAAAHGAGEFAALILRDAMSRHLDILLHPAFRALRETPLGKLLNL